MLVLGLTGSIGMGKSTAASFLRQRGVPVHEADLAVHRLYEGAAVEPIEAEFPGVSVNGAVDRARLAERIVGDPRSLARLEAIVHPLVRASAAEFIRDCRKQGLRIAVVEAPLLLETHDADAFDAIAVVSASAEIQRARVLARPGMTEEKFAALLARQLPDSEKRRRAHFVIDSSQDRAFAARQVDSILSALAFAV